MEDTDRHDYRDLAISGSSSVSKISFEHRRSRFVSTKSLLFRVDEVKGTRLERA